MSSCTFQSSLNVLSIYKALKNRKKKKETVRGKSSAQDLKGAQTVQEDRSNCPRTWRISSVIMRMEKLSEIFVLFYHSKRKIWNRGNTLCWWCNHPISKSEWKENQRYYNPPHTHLHTLEIILLTNTKIQPFLFVFPLPWSSLYRLVRLCQD